jgi:hypothetical protein
MDPLLMHYHAEILQQEKLDRAAAYRLARSVRATRSTGRGPSSAPLHRAVSWFGQAAHLSTRTAH